MNIAKTVLQNRVAFIMLTFLVVGFGIISYQRLGRLALPDFDIKTAMIITPYPGAGAAEVEEEVTDVVEEAVQSLSELDYVESKSQEGLSIVFAEIKPEYTSEKLPQIWDELRRKVNDIQGDLPPGARPSIVNDDYGDVYGVYFAISGSSYSYAELKEYAKYLKKELLLVDNVAKIDFWGDQPEVIYVEFSRAKMNQMGISPARIIQTLDSQNLVEPAGKVKVGPEYLRFNPSGEISGEQAIADLYVAGEDGRLFRLGDIAHVYRGYQDPPDNLMRFNGKPAIGLGISTETGGNVVRMGQAVMKRIQELEAAKPPGMRIDLINYQARRVTESLNTFLINLAEAVAIVIALLLIFMGLRSGLLMGAILLLTILGTFIVMHICDITLQKVSLGALVLALGLLVDNAIVLTDVFLIKLKSGVDRQMAAEQSVKTTIWPLFAATLVAILAFVPVGLNTGAVGEFCQSLFYVIAISLFLSWILAVTITPLFCVLFLPTPKVHLENPYDTPWYRRYRRLLHGCIKRRWVSLLVLLAVLIASVFGFGTLPKAFFSESTRNQFYVDYWLPEGTHISEVEKDLAKINAFIAGQKDVQSVTAFIGEGSLRFLLSYNYQSRDTSYGQLLVQVTGYEAISSLLPKIHAYIRLEFPGAEAKVHRFQEGPPIEYAVEARFRGPDTAVLSELANRAKKILYADGGAVNIRDDWRQPVKTLRPKYAEVQGRRSGVSRSDISKTLQWNFTGIPTGLYREHDELLPIVFRPPEKERCSISNFNDIQVWSRPLYRFLPIRQIVEKLETVQESPLIKRRNRMRTITVQCDPIVGQASALENRVREKIESIPKPLGYTVEWGGESEENLKGQAGLKKLFPICLLGMFVLVVCLFNSMREPLIIFLCIPLAIIGITLGLLAFRLPFGFLSILGFLGLTGMLVKNCIVLLDQVKQDLKKGKPRYQALLDASVSRLRPVTMAAGTTILGMSPLLFHPFFASMAATIMGGLLVATVLTLLIAPILYTFFFRVTFDQMELDIPAGKKDKR
ncbi:MAG: efflux RND transporter permease subunit [Deltaproteobacteria bacterium]|nr:efflux RND transporter permease subunit [Deltaproteobacteria bacterium]